MNGIEVGYSTEELNFRNGLCRLCDVIEHLSNDDVASALKAACESAYIRTCKKAGDEVDDKKYYDLLDSLSPVAKVLCELMETIMDIGA